jgi:hypothetical protein
MSHVATIKTQMRDKSALKAAVEALGGVWKEGQKTATVYTGTQRSDHAFGLPGVRYEVGVTQELDGTLSLNFDPYGGSWSGGRHDGHKLVEKFGQRLEKVKQGYSSQLTAREMARAGFRVQMVPQKDGTVRVRGYQS